MSIKIIDKEKLEEGIKRIAKQDIENESFGVGYCVMQNGQKVYEGYFGSKGPDRYGELNGKTMYRLASMTKPITAVAVLILVDRGLLKLDDTVKTYIPEFKDMHVITDGVDKGIAKNDVKIFHLLSHTSGFGLDSHPGVKYTAEYKADIKSTIKFFCQFGLAFEPMSADFYSSFGSYDVLAAIVEKVSGKDFGDFLKKEIFEPCNMLDTTFSPTDEQWSRMISMHTTENGKSVVGSSFQGYVMGDFPSSHKLGGAGLASTLDDYVKFAQMLLNNGMGENGRVLSAEIFPELYKTYIPENCIENPRNHYWGLGVRVITDESYENLPVGCYGWSGAYGSHFWVDPENKITAVFMKNTKAAIDRYEAGRRFEKVVTDSLI